MLIQNEHIYFRALESSDLDLLYDSENDVSVWKVSNTITPYSKDVLAQYLENAYQDIYTTKQLRLVIALLGSRDPIGTIDLFDFDPTHSRLGVGILIFENYRRQGYAAQVLELLKNYTCNILFMHMLYCNISESNTESIKLFENAGFEKIGIKKDWNRVSYNQFENELMYQYIML